MHNDTFFTFQFHDHDRFHGVFAFPAFIVNITVILTLVANGCQVIINFAGILSRVKVYGLQIVDAEGRIFRKYLAADASVAPIPVLSGRCIPDFGYPFKAGGQYGIQVETFFTDARRPGGNSYSASFRLYREQGVLKVARAG